MLLLAQLPVPKELWQFLPVTIISLVVLVMVGVWGLKQVVPLFKSLNGSAGALEEKINSLRREHDRQFREHERRIEKHKVDIQSEINILGDRVSIQDRKVTEVAAKLKP